MRGPARWADSSRVRPLYTVDPVAGLRDVIASRGGAAQVGLLFGAVNSSGKLPTAYPRSVQDISTAARPERYPGTDEGDGYPVMRYSEGLRRPARASRRSFVVPEGTFTVQHP